MGLFDKLFKGKEEGQKRNFQTLEESVPYLEIEDNQIILKDGRVAIGYEFVGAPFESMSAEDHEAFNRMYETALLTLPAHYIVQKLDVYMNVQYEFGRFPQAYEAKGFFEKMAIRHFGERPVLRQRSYVFVISNNLRNQKTFSQTTSLSKKGRLLKGDFNKIEQRMDQLELWSKSFIDTLISTGAIKAIRLNDVDLGNLYYQFLNLEFKEGNNVNEPYKEILNQHNALSIGEKRLNIISMEEQGEEIYHSVPNDYNIPSAFTYKFGLDLQFPHITITSWYIEDSKSVLTSLEWKKKLTSNTGNLGGQEAKEKARQLDEYIAESLSNQTKFVSVSLQVMIYTLSDLARERNVQAAADAFRSSYGLKPLIETFDSANLFFACMPGAAGNINRWVLSESDRASCYVNPTMEFASKKQGDYFADRYCNLVYVDVFNRELNNQNCIVVGPPGSGKSFTWGHLVLQRYERSERQIGIDVGGTYKNTYEALGSNDPKSNVRYFEYSPENPIKFNPFYCMPNKDGEFEISEDKLGFIITLMELLIKPKGQSWTNSEWSIMQTLIPLYFQDLGIRAKTSKTMLIPKLDDFCVWLEDHREKNKSNEDFKKRYESFDITTVLLILEPFVKGKYKALLNSDDTLDISDYRLVCFDMARVKDDERLYPIVSLLLMELSMDVIRKFPEEKKHFFMDEAWSMLTESMGGFVAYLYRTIRKCNGSMTIITQGVEELDTPIGNTIKNFSETKIVLNHTNDATRVKVATAFGLTETALNLIRSIRVEPSRREIFMQQGNRPMVLLLEAPLSEQAILTSNPVERNHLNRLKNLYGNIQAAVGQWIEDKTEGKFNNK